MIQLYADDVLVYDSRVEDYELEGLSATTGMNIGGTADIILPATHPHYDIFVGHRTVVTIYRDGVLRFRGRALYPTDDFYNSRTITCEGELCFLRDGICRPHLYTADVATVFAAVIGEYNAQVESWKQFRVGEVTVVDDYIRLESESAETVLDTVNKLLERCGGYIIFTTAADGARVINWYASVSSANNQAIEFGENLLDFSRTGANTDMATGLIPYGAMNEVTRKRVTIESVNGGKDYILADDARAVRGTIMATATWDDVTEPANLLKKAQAYLDDRKVFVTSLELTTLDLSYMDQSMDSFTVGDLVRIISAPHGIDEDFQLTQMTEDFINPANSVITLGKDVTSLTGADVAGDKQGQNNINSATVLLQSELMAGLEKVAADLEKTLQQNIHIDASGDLVSGISIKLSVGEHEEEATLDKFKVRQAFADDTAAVDIKKGSVHFGSGTFSIVPGAAVTDQRQMTPESIPDYYLNFVDALNPVRFTTTSGTYHVGFDVAGVEAALEEASMAQWDFGGLVSGGLVYEEFIGLLLLKIKQLEQRLAALEGEE